MMRPDTPSESVPPVPPGTPRWTSADIVALLRAFFPVVALLLMMLPVPYAQLDELHTGLFLAHGDAPDPWRTSSTLTFWEAVSRRPNEIHWLWLPVTSLALIGWERFEAHLRRRAQQSPSLASPIGRMVVLLSVLMALAASTFNLDLFGEWSMSLGKVVLVISGLSTLVGIIVEIVAARGGRHPSPPRDLRGSGGGG